MKRPKTMIGAIWLLSGIRGALCCCTYWELRSVLAVCEEALTMRHSKAERAEYEHWRWLLISEIQRRQLAWWLGPI
jgi:hypothetical protein